MDQPEATAQTMSRPNAAKGRGEEVGFRVQIEDLLVEQVVAHVEERGERIAVAKELGEGGPRIAVELICKRVARRTAVSCACKSAFQG